MGPLLAYESSFWVFRGHFEVTLSISTSNFMCDACVIHTCTGLVGPKTGKVEKVFVFKAFLKGSMKPRVRQSREQLSEPGPFRGRKVKFLMWNALCIYLELCFLPRQGAHFQKIRKKRWSDIARWSKKRLHGKYDGYRRGLGGAKKRKC